jgi:hypothetical protein
MGSSNVRGTRWETGGGGPARHSNGTRGALYVSRAARSQPEPVNEVRTHQGNDSRVRRLRELAAEGRLADAAAEGSPYRAALTGAAYDLVWPIVFARLTRRFEQQRGHTACAAGVANLADECLDRFHDDVEAVVEDLLTYARQPILQVEAWVTARLGAATVNAHRRRRGSRGALQRPRLPAWLAGALGGDRWLTTLATDILVWVGVRATAGHQVWPVETWAQERGRLTGDWQASDAATVEREIALVLTAMRHRPAWYESFVERPLGAKQPPVAAAATDAYGEPIAPLTLGDADEEVEAELQRLAGDAVRDIGDRLQQGEEAKSAVVEVIRTVFGGVLAGTLDRMPHSAADPLGGVTGALADRRRVDHIVSTAIEILGEGDGHRTVGEPSP